MARAIDADELEKKFGYGPNDTEEERAFNQAARKIIREMPTHTPPNEWVSVDERLPEPEFEGQQRGFYLVALSNGIVKELMYEFRHYENMMFDVGWHETAFPVTHWMPLPAPPDRRPPEGEVDGK